MLRGGLRTSRLEKLQRKCANVEIFMSSIPFGANKKSKIVGASDFLIIHS